MAATSFFGGEFFGGEFFNTPTTTTGGGGVQGGPGGSYVPKRKRVTWQGREYWDDDLKLHLKLLDAVRRSREERKPEPEGLQAQPPSTPVAEAPEQSHTVPVLESEIVLPPMYPALPDFSAQIRQEMMLGHLVLVAAMQRAAEEFLQQEDDEALLVLLMASA